MGFLFSFCSGELSVHVEEHYLINCHRPWLYVLCHSAQRCIEIHFMPQTEVVTQGFVLRCDPDSQQLCLCLASESQLSTSPAPAVIWNTYKAVANYMLHSHSLCLIQGAFTLATVTGPVGSVVAVADGHCRGIVYVQGNCVQPLMFLQCWRVRGLGP